MSGLDSTAAQRKLWLRPISALIGALLAAMLFAQAAAADNPVGWHSMLYSNSPDSFKQVMFSEAHKAGVAEIRVDVDLSMIFAKGPLTPNWSSLDEYVRLSDQYRLPIEALLTSPPPSIAPCPPGVAVSPPNSCAADPIVFGSEAQQIARHTARSITHFEILNEPDVSREFYGTPQDYAAMLSAAYDGVHAANASARVLLGGMSGPSAMAWLQAAFSTSPYDAAHKFDIANVHIRTAVDQLPPTVSAWKQFFASYGFQGPLWVTEHGYPSDPAFQYDGSYRGTDGPSGAAAQATYLEASLPALVGAGAARVFVTGRDNLSGGFASEGLLGGNVSDPAPPNPQVVEKAAYAALARIIAAFEGRAGQSAAGGHRRHRPSLGIGIRRRRLHGRVRGCRVRSVTLERRAASAWRFARVLPVGAAGGFASAVRGGTYRVITHTSRSCLAARSRAVRA